MLLSLSLVHHDIDIASHIIRHNICVSAVPGHTEIICCVIADATSHASHVTTSVTQTRVGVRISIVRGSTGIAHSIASCHDDIRIIATALL